VKARVLLWDCETSPLIIYSWDIYDTNAIKVIKEGQILCFSWKWLGEKKVQVLGQDDFKGYKPGINNDKSVVEALWGLFDEADVVIAHNGNSYDQKYAQARMMVHDMKPPSPYQQIDTKLVAKRYGRFSSNKLDDLGRNLSLGQKLDTGGFSTWEGCMAGDDKAWAMMKKYNKQDVALLEQLYTHLRPWISNHPALNVIENRPESCKNCGGTKIHAGMKYRATNTNLYQYFSCMGCGANLKSRIPEPRVKEEKMKYV
jgi:hypothetical protein